MSAAQTPAARISQLATHALLRGTCRPFVKEDWYGFADCAAPAYMVQLHPGDLRHLLDAVGAADWPTEWVTVIFDANGLSLCASSPVNSYAYQVDLRVSVDPDTLPDNGVGFWEVDRRTGPDLYSRIAALPPHQRSLVMACPVEAQPHVVAGIEAEQQRQATESVAVGPGLTPTPAAPQPPTTYWLTRTPDSRLAWGLYAPAPQGGYGPEYASSPDKYRLLDLAGHLGLNVELDPEHADKP